MQFGFKRGAAALTLSQTNWVREVSGELCGVTPMLMKAHLQSHTSDMQRRMSSLSWKGLPQHLQSRVIHHRLARDLTSARIVHNAVCSSCVRRIWEEADLLFLMFADCTVRELQSLNGAVQTRMQVATRTILPDITRLAETPLVLLGKRLWECSSCARICLLEQWTLVSSLRRAYVARFFFLSFLCCEAPSGLRRSSNR